MKEIGRESVGEDLLIVGRILRPHGLRGAVVVEVISDFEGRFDPGSRLLVDRGPAGHEEVAVEHSTPLGRDLLVRLSGVESLEGAEALKGRDLVIRGDMAAPLAEGEYWLHELVGMTVREEGGRELGRVTGLESSSLQDLLVVEGAGRREFRIPFVGEFVVNVDRDSSTVTVRLIEGMVP